MRVLLTANASYVPPRGGATRANLVWMDALARAGHDCRIVAAALPQSAGGGEQMRQERIEQSGARQEEGIEIGRRGPIEVWSVADPGRRANVLREQIAQFRPDWVLASSEDLGHTLLREALHAAPGRVVFLAHTPQFFPFGRESWNPDPHGAGLVAACAGIVAIGRAMAAYVEDAIHRPCAVIHPPIYGPGPFPEHRNFGLGAVLMVNPCAVKGISIFLALAAHFHDCEFAVLPGWGTTAEDRRDIDGVLNIRVLPNCRHIDEALSQTRVLLMPSRWFEGFGLIVMEAMLRGIPVVASDAGGLLEAKQGTGYVIPVPPIERYEPEFDERGMPRPILTQPDLGPWQAALRELLTDREAYEREAARSRCAALAFVEGLDAGGLEKFLRRLEPLPAAAPSERPHIEALTPAQRALLLQRMRKRRPEAR
jgi:glycosyltransferase involved in cell wall biosynthesis